MGVCKSVSGGAGRGTPKLGGPRAALVIPHLKHLLQLRGVLGYIVPPLHHGPRKGKVVVQLITSCTVSQSVSHRKSDTVHISTHTHTQGRTDPQSHKHRHTYLVTQSHSHSHTVSHKASHTVTYAHRGMRAHRHMQAHERAVGTLAHMHIWHI